MSQTDTSAWDRLIKELQNPWDWTAAFIGGGGGAIVTIVTHGADFGHAIPAGALTVVGARRALVASMARATLKKRADALLLILKRDDKSGPEAIALQDYKEKWESKIIDNEAFAKHIMELSNQDSKRKIKDASPPTLHPKVLSGKEPKRLISSPEKD